jgi:hypothetical protein
MIEYVNRKGSDSYKWDSDGAKNMMRKLIILALVAISFCVPPLQAHCVYRDSTYSIGLACSYAYNETYEHYGAFSVDAYLPVHRHFEGEVNIRMLTANSYDLGGKIRPKFYLPVGELYLETQILYNLIRRNSLHGVCGAFSIGYRMDYVQVHIGYGTRSFWPLFKSTHTSETSVHEPHNLVYYVEVFARPHTSSWNISACVTDMTEYQMERMFTPMFILNSYVNIGAHWRITARALCKPVGLSNLTPSFYGAEVRVGGYYRF